MPPVRVPSLLTIDHVLEALVAGVITLPSLLTIDHVLEALVAGVITRQQRELAQLRKLVDEPTE